MAYLTQDLFDSLVAATLQFVIDIKYGRGSNSMLTDNEAGEQAKLLAQTVAGYATGTYRSEDFKELGKELFGVAEQCRDMLLKLDESRANATTYAQGFMTFRKNYEPDGQRKRKLLQGALFNRGKFNPKRGEQAISNFRAFVIRCRAGQAQPDWFEW